MYGPNYKTHEQELRDNGYYNASIERLMRL